MIRELHAFTCAHEKLALRKKRQRVLDHRDIRRRVVKVWSPGQFCAGVERLAAVGTALVNFFLQAAVLVLVLGVTRYSVAWSYVPLLVPALLALVLLVAGLGVALAALNVYVRDVQHLVGK